MSRPPVPKKTPSPSSSSALATPPAIEFSSPQAKEAVLNALLGLDDALLALRTAIHLSPDLAPSLDQATTAVSSLRHLLFPPNPSQGRILLIDQNRSRIGEWKKILQTAGFDVEPAEDHTRALRQVTRWEPDLMIVSWGLIQLDAAFLGRLRDASSAILVVLAERTILRRGHDLLRQADDLMLDTVASDGLVERVRALLQRNSHSGTRLVFGPLTIDLASRDVTLDGQAVPLTPIEYRLLYALASHPGRILTHEQLLKLGWGPEYTKENDYLWVHMSRLRRKLKLSGHPELIETERGIGYRLHIG